MNWILLLAAGLVVQPSLNPPLPQGYGVGDRVDGGTLLLSREMETRKLSEIVTSDSKVVVLTLLGGGAPSAPVEHPLRGGLWCLDTFDDLPLQRALVRHFRDQPVQFVAVAVPPVYDNTYGFEEDVFVRLGEQDPLLRSQAQMFIELTEQTRDSGVMPFKEIYYDPKFRLARRKRLQPDPDAGSFFPWQGRLRWYRDSRKYGTPTLWILDRDLTVLREPFVENNYNFDPPQIAYDFRDVRDAIAALLEPER